MFKELKSKILELEKFKNTTQEKINKCEEQNNKLKSDNLTIENEMGDLMKLRKRIPFLQKRYKSKKIWSIVIGLIGVVFLVYFWGIVINKFEIMRNIEILFTGTLGISSFIAGTLIAFEFNEESKRIKKILTNNSAEIIEEKLTKLEFQKQKNETEVSYNNEVIKEWENDIVEINDEIKSVLLMLYDEPKVKNKIVNYLIDNPANDFSYIKDEDENKKVKKIGSNK